MATSAVHPHHFKMADKERNMDRDNRLVVGAVVSTFPSRASWSLYPRTTSRALARGLPSGFLLHLSSILEVRVRCGSVSLTWANSQTPFSKKLLSSLILACMNCSRSIIVRPRSLSSEVGFFLMIACLACRATFFAGAVENMASSFLVAPLI